MVRRLHLADREFVQSPLNRPPEIIDAKRGLLSPDGRRKVAIYGAGMGSDAAPLDDPAWTVWALNLIAPIDKQGRLRADAWWDIHQIGAQTPDDMRWIAKCPVPIIVPPCLMDASENAVALPMKRMLREFPSDAPYACTFAFQISLALLMGYETIGLFGMELAYGSPRERTVEWASVSWWIGFARGRGVEILTPAKLPGAHPARLGRHPFLYGLQYDAEIEDTKKYLKLMREGEEHRIDG